MDTERNQCETMTAAQPSAPACSGAAWHDSVDNCYYSTSPQVRRSAGMVLSRHASPDKLASLIDMISESEVCGSKELTKQLITPIVNQLVSEDKAERMAAANFLLSVIADVISLRLQRLADRRNDVRMMYATDSIVRLWVPALLLIELLRWAEGSETTKRLRYDGPSEHLLTPSLLLIAATILAPRAPQPCPSVAQH